MGLQNEGLRLSFIKSYKFHERSVYSASPIHDAVLNIVGHREMIFQPSSACCRIPADHFAAISIPRRAGGTLISVRPDVEATIAPLKLRQRSH